MAESSVVFTFLTASEERLKHAASLFFWNSWSLVNYTYLKVMILSVHLMTDFLDLDFH
jgi:hypothetical protein